MKFFWAEEEGDFDQAISELRAEEPDAKMLSASAERVWQRLQTGEAAEVPTAAAQPIRGCADIRALLAAFHQQQLPAARALIVRDHLRECASCRSDSSGREVGGRARGQRRIA